LREVSLRKKAFWSRRQLRYQRFVADATSERAGAREFLDGGSTRGRGAVACNEKLSPAPS